MHKLMYKHLRLFLGPYLHPVPEHGEWLKQRIMDFLNILIVKLPVSGT
jgi:hypothetical protein